MTGKQRTLGAQKGKGGGLGHTKRKTVTLEHTKKHLENSWDRGES